MTGGSSDVLLVRYLTDGQLDATFGVGGAVTTDFGAGDGATALALQPDGKLVVAGESGISQSQNTILARYHPDGSLDESFGVGGKVSVNLGGVGNIPNLQPSVSALLLQADGKLVVTGSWFNRVTPSNLFVARFQPDGNLDPTFGQAGAVIFFEGSGGSAPSSAGRAVIQQPDGRLVVAGFRQEPSSTSAGTLLVRFLPDGEPDPTFGTEGIVITNVGVPAFSNALIQQPDGKLVTAGQVAGGPIDMLLARYLPDGGLDPAFGTGGIVVTDVGGKERPTALLQQPDGTLVVAGSFGPTTLPGSTSNESAILLARYQALGCPSPTGALHRPTGVLCHRRIPRGPGADARCVGTVLLGRRAGHRADPRYRAGDAACGLRRTGISPTAHQSLAVCGGPLSGDVGAGPGTRRNWTGGCRRS